MSLSQSEKALAAEIGFDESVLEVVKQECQAEMQKLLFEQEVYLKDSELGCLSDVLPAYYLDFSQDIYGTYNYEGKLLIEGLSTIVPSHLDYKQIFFKLKQFLTSRDYIVVCDRQFGFLAKQHGLKQLIVRLTKKLLKTNLNIIVFKSKDHLDIIKIYQTNAWNHALSPRDIIKKLESWQAVCKFEIIFASNSSFYLTFTEIPEDLSTFAKDVCEFCPNVQKPRSVVREIEKHKSLYLAWN